MRRDPIALVWLAGLGLAVLLTVFGPILPGFEPLVLLRRAAAAVEADLAALGDPALRMVRGFAIAFLAVFVVLCVLARRRGLPAIGLAIAVAGLFVLLAGGPGAWGGPLRAGHWPWALLLTVAASLLMTRRLRE